MLHITNSLFTLYSLWYSHPNTSHMYVCRTGLWSTSVLTCVFSRQPVISFWLKLNANCALPGPTPVPLPFLPLTSTPRLSSLPLDNIPFCNVKQAEQLFSQMNNPVSPPSLEPLRPILKHEDTAARCRGAGRSRPCLSVLWP